MAIRRCFSQFALRGDGGLAEAFAAKLALSSASPDSLQKSHNPAATARLKTLHSLVQAGSPHPHTREIGSYIYIYIGYHPHGLYTVTIYIYMYIYIYIRTYI